MIQNVLYLIRGDKSVIYVLESEWKRRRKPFLGQWVINSKSFYKADRSNAFVSYWKFRKAFDTVKTTKSSSLYYLPPLEVPPVRTAIILVTVTFLEVQVAFISSTGPLPVRSVGISVLRIILI